MKVKLFKGLLAVMLIGLFVSCSQKKEDFQNDKESKRMVVNKVKKDYVPEGKKFYLVDVSGSMQGKGSVRTSDIFTSVIEDMSFAFSKITDSCEIVIIPFSSMPLSPISFNSFDKENMNTALQNLTVSNGNTNIYSAFQKAVEKFDSTTNNIVFFITDGLHNEYVTEEVLYETLNSFSEKAESKYSHLYYYLKTPDYKEFDFYKVFEKNDNMDVIESLVFTKEVNDTTFVTTPIVADSKGGFNFPMWILWILLAIIAIIILYFIITKVNPHGFGVPINNIVRPLPNNSTPLTDIERKKFEEETGLSSNVSKDIRTKEQADLFKKGNYKEVNVPGRNKGGVSIPGRSILVPTELPLNTPLKDMPGVEDLIKEERGHDYWEKVKGWTNKDLMGDGESPYFPQDLKHGLPAEGSNVHHNNQTHDSSYTIMRNSIHKKNHGILHDKGNTEIDRGHFGTYERPAMLCQFVETLKEMFGGWDNIPDNL